jgi:surface protein
MVKPQVYVAKGNAPWFSSSGSNWEFWEDATHVLSIDKSILGQATVTCKDVTDMGSMFYDCNKLTSIDLSSFDTSKVTNMSYMFDSCSSLTTLDLSNFDTSNVKK